MVKPFRLFKFFFYSVFIFSSLVKADLITENEVAFLDHDNNTSMAERLLIEADLTRGKEIAFLDQDQSTSLVEASIQGIKSATELSLSTLAGLGFWFALCETVDDTVRKKAGQRDIDICLSLAPIFATTEVTLAGHISPWILERAWRQFLRFAGAGMAVYVTYVNSKTYVHSKEWAMLVGTKVVLTYLAVEATARTTAGIVSALISSKKENTKLSDDDALHYMVLSIVSGLMVGAVVHEGLIRSDVRPSIANLALVISASTTGSLIDYLSKDGSASGAIEGGGGAAIGAIIVVAGEMVARNVFHETFNLVNLGAAGGMLVGSLSGAIGIAFTAAQSEDVTEAGVLDVPLTVLKVEAGTILGAVAGGLLTCVDWARFIPSKSQYKNNEQFSLTYINSLFNRALITVISVNGIALMSSFHNYAIHSHPIENTLSEISRTLWLKYYAPIEYLRTVFDLPSKALSD